MTAFELSPEAEDDLWNIWRYLAQESGIALADRVQASLFERMEFLAGERF